MVAGCKARRRHQEFLSFLRTFDKNVPKQLDVHLILDNHATHKHAKVKGWIAGHPRFQLHFAPTYSSWLNGVERWFGLISQCATCRSSFTSVRTLKQKTMDYVEIYNRTACPFQWTATAESILQKLEQPRSRISGTAHQPRVEGGQRSRIRMSVFNGDALFAATR
ncbi:MAG: transposase [Spirochaetaceae bacterium]|nr:transposase [Spirochaetaceae bacterium]